PAPACSPPSSAAPSPSCCSCRAPTSSPDHPCPPSPRPTSPGCRSPPPASSPSPSASPAAGSAPSPPAAPAPRNTAAGTRRSRAGSSPAPPAARTEPPPAETPTGPGRNAPTGPGPSHLRGGASQQPVPHLLQQHRPPALRRTQRRRIQRGQLRLEVDRPAARLLLVQPEPQPPHPAQQREAARELQQPGVHELRRHGRPARTRLHRHRDDVRRAVLDTERLAEVAAHDQVR